MAEFPQKLPRVLTTRAPHAKISHIVRPQHKRPTFLNERFLTHYQKNYLSPVFEVRKITPKSPPKKFLKPSYLNDKMVRKAYGKEALKKDPYGHKFNARFKKTGSFKASEGFEDEGY